MKQIVLCADDYGQNPSISQAIIELIQKKRISATSCMTNSAYWDEHSQWLISFKNDIDVGLHLNFTEGKPISSIYTKKYGEKMFPLHQLLMRCFLKMIDRNAIESEIYAQLDGFEKSFNQLPDFIDGHQHIHHFPVIRDILLDIYEKRLRHSSSYIRNVQSKIIHFPKNTFLKKIIIQHSGANIFRTLMMERNIPHNQSFSGIYHFPAGETYKTLFPLFLDEVQENGLIMCHPGLSNITFDDPIYFSRAHEYEYFLSDTFLQDCNSKRVQVRPFTSVKKNTKKDVI